LILSLRRQRGSGFDFPDQLDERGRALEWPFDQIWSPGHNGCGSSAWAAFE